MKTLGAFNGKICLNNILKDLMVLILDRKERETILLIRKIVDLLFKIHCLVEMLVFLKILCQAYFRR